MITLEKLRKEKVDFGYLKKFWDSYVWEQRLNTGTRHNMVIEGFELVTYGYVPWSISSRVAFAPSQSISAR